MNRLKKFTLVPSSTIPGRTGCTVTLGAYWTKILISAAGLDFFESKSSKFRSTDKLSASFVASHLQNDQMDIKLWAPLTRKILINKSLWCLKVESYLYVVLWSSLLGVITSCEVASNNFVPSTFFVSYLNTSLIILFAWSYHVS